MEIDTDEGDTEDSTVLPTPVDDSGDEDSQ